MMSFIIGRASTSFGLIRPSAIGRRVSLPNTLASSNADSPMTISWLLCTMYGTFSFVSMFLE